MSSRPTEAEATMDCRTARAPGGRLTISSIFGSHASRNHDEHVWSDFAGHKGAV
jgi:hypothetical protein